ncbi:MAG: hypothetical protein IPK68_22075 [Bdellovibrionales bacterium]|nr:hypothetical protein [Bdellovibrionales bacterium]
MNSRRSDRPLKGYTRTHKHTTGTEVDIETPVGAAVLKGHYREVWKKRMKSDFESLILVAPPKFWGECVTASPKRLKLVRGSLNKETTLARKLRFSRQ